MKGTTVRRQDFDSLLDKADSVDKVEWSANVDSSSVGMVAKAGDDFLIWGPASVEIVDKEGDKITADALEKALPQLLKRARLSYAHTDQIVGRILDSFETKEETTVTVDGIEYERKMFPTDVLERDDEPPALFVAGEVFDDSNQASEVREKIKEGEIDSYSISGEALVTQKRVEDDHVYDDVLELDLSAVTLCEQGMNQDAKFARVSDQVDVENTKDAAESPEVDTKPSGSDGGTPETAKSMSKSDSDESDTEEFVKQSELPDSLVSKNQVENMIEKRVSSHLPESPLASKDHVEGRIADEMSESAVSKDDMDGAEQRIKALEKSIRKLKSQMKSSSLQRGDYEEDEEEEMEEEEKQEGEGAMGDYEEDEEDEMEGGHEGDHDKSFSPEELKAELPEDVWKVVSEYVPTDAGDKSVTKENDDSDLEEEVKEILSGEAVNSTGIPTEDPDDEIGKWVEMDDDDEDSSTVESPALSMWE